MNPNTAPKPQRAADVDSHALRAALDTVRWERRGIFARLTKTPKR